MAGDTHPFIEFERKIGLGSTHAAKLLGLPYVSYAQVRSSMRPLKPCHVKHIEVILLLPRKTLQRLIEREING